VVVVVVVAIMVMDMACYFQLRSHQNNHQISRLNVLQCNHLNSLLNNPLKNRLNNHLNNHLNNLQFSHF